MTLSNGTLSSGMLSNGMFSSGMSPDGRRSNGRSSNGRHPTGTFLVCGATGAQGSAVVRAALEAGCKVRVLLRPVTANPFGDAVEVARGDFDEPGSLVRAAAGTDGVYLVLPTGAASTQRLRWACNLIDATVRAGAGRLVFNTSAPGVDHITGVAVLDNRLEIERYLQDAPIPSVVLRTTVSMDALTGPWTAPAIVNQGVFAAVLPPHQPVSWISWDEAARLAVAALCDPALAARKPILQTGGKRALSCAEIVDVLGGVLGRRIGYLQLSLADFETALMMSFGRERSREIARYYAWVTDPANGNPLDVDLAPLRGQLPMPQQEFADWARQVPWTRFAQAVA